MTSKSRRSASQALVGPSAFSLGLGVRALVAFVALALLALVGCSGGSKGTAEDDLSDGVGPDDVVGTETTDDAVNQDAVTDGPPIGVACTDAGGECAGGICAGLLPLGYCTLACDTAACPSGTVCQTINDFPFCMRACASSADCRTADGYACIDGACNIACKTMFDCGPDQQCVSGECVDPVPDRIVGASCSSSKQCVSGYCLSEFDGGVCSEPCTIAGCSLEGWTCHGIVPVGGDQPLNLCGPGAVFTSDEIELSGTSPYSFNVTSDVVSFLIVAEGSQPESFLFIENLRRPDGTLAAGPLNNSYYTEPLRLFPDSGHASAMVPNNNRPDLQVVPGRWQFDVGTGFGPPRRVRVFLKRTGGSGEITHGAFDINIFIAQGAMTGLSAATAPSNNYLQGALERMRTKYWAQAFLTIGTVNYYDIPSSYTFLSDMTELSDMFANQSTAGPDGAINLFLVRDMQLGQAVGISGGIPGPVGVPGTGGSGVALALQGNSSQIGDAMTHEIGHFLAFFHVSEYQGEMDDVIDDTPICSRTPENLLDFGLYDACMENIMFPVLLTGWVQQELSATQARVARLNPRAN